MSSKSRKIAAKQQPPKKDKRGVHIALICTAAVAAVVIVAAALYFALGTKEEPPANVQKNIISISYPDLQEDGEIVQTNRGMTGTNATTLREALEGDWAQDFATEFAEDGSIAAIGELRANSGKSGKFIISTYSTSDGVYNKGYNLLSDKPGEVQLVDGYTYEITYVDEEAE